MSGIPVTLVDSGGLAVTAVDSGAPLMTAVEAGGLAVTLVDSGGLPFVVEGAVSYDFYVDSVNGSDANDGTSAETAFASIAKLQTAGYTEGQTIGLARGSYWQEVFKPSAAVDIIAYGEGATPPTFDGADVIAPGAFALSAHADAAGVVYETTLTRAPTSEGNVYVSGDSYMMWENGAWLVRRTSVALCAANPGSFYVPQPNALSTPSLAYVHPFGSTNPTSDGKTYEYSKRSSGIEAKHLNGCTFEGIHTKRGCGAYGSFTFGENSTLRKCLFSYGGKHNTVGTSGVLEDCIAFDAETGRSVLADGGMIPFTIYNPTTAGMSFTMRRCMTIFPTGRFGGQAVYSHNSSGDIYDTATIEGHISLRGGSVEPLGKAVALEDCVSLDNTSRAIQLSPNTPNGGSIMRALVRAPSPISGIINYPNAGGTPGLAVEIADCAVLVQAGSTATGTTINIALAGNVNLHHNMIATYGNGVSFADNGGAGSQFKNNIHIDARPNAGASWWQGSSNCSVNDNVYAAVTGMGSRIWWQTPGSGTAATIAEWRTESGNDANSVVLTNAQTETMLLNTVADLANGDFRLQPTSGGNLVDGTPIYGNVGPRYHYNWNTRTVDAGAPFAFPTPPATEADCAAYIVDPTAWDFYP